MTDVRKCPHAKTSVLLDAVSAKETFFAQGSRQPVEKVHFRQENPRKSKLSSWKNLDGARAGFAGFG
jgi:hypothetical protein